MKKSIIILQFILVLFSTKLYSQWNDFGGNNLGGGEYLGANALSTFPLEFKTIPTGANALPINFYTANSFRATLDATGRFGLGTSTPLGLFHMDDNASSNTDFRITNASTVNTLTDGFSINLFGSTVNFRQRETAPINFISNDAIAPAPLYRLSISHVAKAGYTSYEPTRVAIHQNGTTINTPRALLHLGVDLNALGTRDWMDIGTFCAGNSDFMYVGLKDESGLTPPISDAMDAVVNWGGNNTITPDNQNDLRFIFTTASSGSDPAAVTSGQEVARMSWNGDVGIGNYYTTPTTNIIRPQRRLEVLNDPYSTPSIPQFRLTYSQNVSPALGIHSDFQTTATGNLIISTENGGTVQNTGIGNFNALGVQPARRLELLDQGANLPQLRLTHTPNANPLLGFWTDMQTTSTGNLKINSSTGLVGINLTAANPANTLEIRQGTNGNSGLRFTNLTNGNTAAINATNKILSVNSSGDVILVQDVGGGSVNNSCASTNLIARWTSSGPTLDCSDIFNNFTTHKVGIVNNTPNYTLDAIGSACFGNTNNTVAPGAIHYQFNNSHPLTVLSDHTSGSGLALLRAYGNASLNAQQRDNFRMFNDQDGLTHIRSIGQSITSTFNISFDHLATIGSTTPLSWLGFSTNSAYRNTVMKEDFNSNPLPSNPNGRLCVEAQNSTLASGRSAITAINLNATNTTNHNIGIWAESNASRTAARNIGGLFKANNIISGFNIGVNAVVEGAQQNTSTNYSIYALCNATGSPNNFGMYAQADGGTANNYGIRTLANGPSGTANNYGVFSEAAFGVNAYAGWFQGNLHYTGALTGPSDSTLKLNAKPLASASQIISQINPLEFTFDKQKYPYMGFPDGLRFGFFAQEIERVLPQFVSNIHYPGKYDDTGKQVYAPFDYKAVDYVAMIPLAFALIKEQEQKINDLQAQMNNCCGLRTVNQSVNEQNITKVELTNSQTIILEQNIPNPFDKETTISYLIPDNIVSAKIIFYNNNGNVLKEVDIKHKGAGSVKVYSPELATGAYNYSLVADGKVIDTKKMVKSAK